MPDTEKKVENEMNRGTGLKSIDPPIFWISVIISAILVIWGAMATDHFSGIIDSVFNFLVGSFGWLYILFVAAVLLITVIIGFSRLGSIRLGKPGEEPEFSTRSWIAMLFSAGMGIGLVFWGVAEPIMHYVTPPPLGGLEGETAEAAVMAGSTSFFHWALHPWALYAFFGLVLAYFGFRRGMPQLPSSTLYPLLGKEGVRGAPGKVFNILAVFATLFGIATSLGLGAQQINSGLGELIGLPVNNTIATVIVLIITVLFILSAVTGIDKGIKYLSNINITIGGILLVLMLILGPTVFILNFIMDALGSYLQNFFELTFITSAVEQSDWPGWWTIFYWAWWISWTPFVGGFIARISRGRTIREFVIGVLIVPSIIGIIWIGTMGGSAIWLEQFGQGGIVDPVMADEAVAFFVTLAEFPLGTLMSVLATILIGTFFITSADSGTFVMGMLTSKGELEPSNGVKITWGIFEGLVAAILILAGGLSALQTAAIAGAFPFMLLMILTVAGILKALNEDYILHEQGEFIGTIDLD
ncbi:BCCT family transporter [Fuchsiella alkaliacetigena]|uniref:BCCT family transporter n=1 Tax=Fuchsiella alkaliacetigena TaxID=957042 RepID=UPI00200A8F9B|nr:BCCT family transporter [Fuchsiella alkaliacetigena]MCK8823728.1 BCCT family transporter [Fuchsiella alkaliacetigena]